MAGTPCRRKKPSADDAVKILARHEGRLKIQDANSEVIARGAKPPCWKNLVRYDPRFGREGRGNNWTIVLLDEDKRPVDQVIVDFLVRQRGGRAAISDINNALKRNGVKLPKWKKLVKNDPRFSRSHHIITLDQQWVTSSDMQKPSRNVSETCLGKARGEKGKRTKPGNDELGYRAEQDDGEKESGGEKEAQKIVLADALVDFVKGFGGKVAFRTFCSMAQALVRQGRVPCPPGPKRFVRLIRDDPRFTLLSSDVVVLNTQKQATQVYPMPPIFSPQTSDSTERRRSVMLMKKQMVAETMLGKPTEAGETTMGSGTSESGNMVQPEGGATGVEEAGAQQDSSPIMNKRKRSMSWSSNLELPLEQQQVKLFREDERKKQKYQRTRLVEFAADKLVEVLAERGGKETMNAAQREVQKRIKPLQLPSMAKLVHYDPRFSRSGNGEIILHDQQTEKIQLKTTPVPLLKPADLVPQSGPCSRVQCSDWLLGMPSRVRPQASDGCSPTVPPLMSSSIKCIGPTANAVITPHHQFVCEQDIHSLLHLLPANFRAKLLQGSTSLTRQVRDIVLDLGRRPYLLLCSQKRMYLCDDENIVTDRDVLRAIEHKLERKIGRDNRAGFDGQLHRISAMKNRQNKIYGFTMRVGRSMFGNVGLINDLLFARKQSSVLILGRPGSGKTTVVREIARVLSTAQESHNVVIVDTSNEIAGDGDVVHPSVGMARRMMVPNLDMQGQVMVEAVQNHTPDVIIVDEIGRHKEASAAKTVNERGVRLVGSAHGDFKSLIRNPQLNRLVGGIHTVELGDMQAAKVNKGKKTKEERAGKPVFDIIIELQPDNFDHWTIIPNVAQAVDDVLQGRAYLIEKREREINSEGTQEYFVACSLQG